MPEASTAPSAVPGLDRSAILMMTLDDETAAEVFRHLSTSDAQRLGKRMATMREIRRDQIDVVLHDFHDEMDQYGALKIKSSDHIRSVLTMALGEKRAAQLIDDIFDDETTGIETLNMMDPATVAEIIRDEHPQIIAAIVVHMERAQAAEVLQRLDEGLRNDVMLRVSTFSGAQPAALAELTEVLTGMLDGQNVQRNKNGGVNMAAEILNLFNTPAEESALTTLRNFDQGLAQRIVDEMFVFEDLAKLDDRTLQRVISDLDAEAMAIALKGASEAVFSRFIKNMSTRAAEMLQEDMEMRGPVRLSQVETQRKNILNTVRQLADSGEIQLASGDDEYV